MKIKRYMKGMLRYLRSTRAVSALEYAILVGIVATAIATALATFSTEISDALTKIGTNVKGAAGPNVNLSGSGAN